MDAQMDRPTAAELLEIVAETLAETVIPATASHAQHQARVAANICRIVGRELAAASQPVTGLPDSLMNVDDETADRAYTDVLELVRAKLDVNKPGYNSHGAAEERSIIA